MNSAEIAIRLGSIVAEAIAIWRPRDPGDPFGPLARVTITGCGPDTVWDAVGGDHDAELLLTDVGPCRCPGDYGTRLVGVAGAIALTEGGWWWWAPGAMNRAGTFPQETAADARAKVAAAYAEVFAPAASRRPA